MMHGIEPDMELFCSLLERGARELGLAMAEENLRAFAVLAAELRKWGRKINLTAITSVEEIAVKHIIDSLVFANIVNDGECVLDIGSGAGFPALPTKIARAAVSVVSVDAVGKKINFQRHVARLLGLCGFEALHERIENLAKTRPHRYDVITSRAFSSLEQFVSLAVPLLADTGRMVAMKGPAVTGELEAARPSLLDMGFEISSVDVYQLPFNKGERSLIVISPRKVF